MAKTKNKDVELRVTLDTSQLVDLSDAIQFFVSDLAQSVQLLVDDIAEHIEKFALHVASDCESFRASLPGLPTYAAGEAVDENVSRNRADGLPDDYLRTDDGQPQCICPGKDVLTNPDCYYTGASD